MSSRLWRSLVLTTLLALLLGVPGAAALIGRAADPPSTNVANVAGIDVDATTIPELQRLMNGRRLTSIQLTSFYLARIRQLNPTLNAVITVDRRALVDAARRTPVVFSAIDARCSASRSSSRTTSTRPACRRPPAHSRSQGSSPRDAFIVKQLRAAGAIIIGKANLSEWANFRSAPSSSGWSGIGGQTNMPYVLDRNPCGSSSGSGVVAAADLAVAAVGTETDGSIVCPSGANGVVGIKPTLGLWSRAGIIPISADQDTAGPMARNVTDAAVLLGAATGVDPDDAATAAQAGNAFTDYTQFLDDEALDGARIGVWRAGTFDPDLTGPVIEPILDDAVDALEDEGATVVEGMDIDLSATAGEFAALLCEFKTDIATYLQTYVEGTNPVTGQPYPQTLAELIAFNKAHPELEGPWNDLIFELAEATNGRDQDCADIRAGVTPPVQDVIDELMARTTSTRSSRSPTARPGRRTRTLKRATSMATSSTSSGRRVLRRSRVTPTSRCRPGTSPDCRRGHVHRRALVGAGADRPGLRLRAGDAGSCPAAVHPDDWRRSVPRCPKPAGSDAGAAAAGDPGFSAISSCASGRGMSRRQRSPAIRPGFVLLPPALPNAPPSPGRFAPASAENGR